MGVEVFVNGRPLTSIGYWGDLEVTHTWPYGSWELKWSMALAPYERPPELVAGADVYCAVGSRRIWAGSLPEPNWASSEFAAVGANREAEGTLCFDAGGETTSVLDTAVDEGIADLFLNWARPVSVSATAFAGPGSTDSLNYLAALADAVTAEQQKRWYVDPWRSFRAAPDPTTPRAMLLPDNGQLGVAAEKQVGTVFGRYLDSTTGTYETVSYGAGRPAKGANWIGLGPMTAARATDLCAGVWAPLQAQTGWTNGLTIHSGQLRTMGDKDMPLWKFCAGPEGMLRLLGVRDPRGLTANTDIVLAKSVWKPGGDNTLQVDPIGKVARDFASIVTSSGGTAL